MLVIHIARRNRTKWRCKKSLWKCKGIAWRNDERQKRSTKHKTNCSKSHQWIRKRWRISRRALKQRDVYGWWSLSRSKYPFSFKDNYLQDHFHLGKNKRLMQYLCLNREIYFLFLLNHIILNAWRLVRRIPHLLKKEGRIV